MSSHALATSTTMERCPEPAVPSGTGRLRNGNPPGDLRLAPRCGARTRSGHSCRQPAMRNGRCRLHGGKSTGPRTPEGLARSRRARWVHGARSREFAALRAEGVRIRRRIHALCDRLQALAALEAGAPPPGRLRDPESGLLGGAGGASGPRRDAVSPVGMGFIVANRKAAPLKEARPADGPSPGSPVAPDVLLDRGGGGCHSFGHRRGNLGGRP